MIWLMMKRMGRAEVPALERVARRYMVVRERAVIEESKTASMLAME